jgi:hypothetical protein
MQDLLGPGCVVFRLLCLLNYRSQCFRCFEKAETVTGRDYDADTTSTLHLKASSKIRYLPTVR